MNLYSNNIICQELNNLVLMLTFLVGSCLASFIMVVAQPGFSIFNYRSRCDWCQKTLTPLQLLPIVSSLVLRRACYKCGHRPAIKYGIIELAIGVVFVINAAMFTDNLQNIVMQLLTILSLHISLWDWYRRQIPLIDFVLLALVSLLWSYSTGEFFLISTLIMGVILISLLALWWLFYHRFSLRFSSGFFHNFPLGIGDLLLFLIISCWLPPTKIPTLLFTVGVGGIVTALIYSKLYKKLFFPFAPAIMVALWLTLVM